MNSSDSNHVVSELEGVLYELPGVLEDTFANQSTEEMWGFSFELDKTDGSWNTFSALGHLHRFLGEDEGGFCLLPQFGNDGLGIGISAKYSLRDPREIARYLKRYFRQYLMLCDTERLDDCEDVCTKVVGFAGRASA